MAVIVLDVMTDYCFDGGDAVLRSLRRRERALQHLLERTRRASVPVIYVNDGLGHWDSNFFRIVEDACRANPDAEPLMRSLSPVPSDFLIVKPRHSAFYATALEPLLEHLRVRTLVLTGVSTENCLWISAADAHVRGYELITPQDTMAGLSPAAVRATLTGLRQVLNAKVPQTARAVRFPARRTTS